MITLMLVWKKRNQFSDIRQNSKLWDGKQYLLPCSLLSSLHSHFPSHTQQLPHHSGVTNFSWALDFGIREGEKEKMKKRGEAVVHWQLRGNHPHRRSLIPSLISSLWPAVCSFCLTNQSEPRAPSTCVASLGLCQFDHCLLPSFRYWRHLPNSVHGAPINLRWLYWILSCGTAANQ